MKKMNTRILMLLAALMVSAVGAKAEDVLYAVKTGTSITISFGEAPAGALTFNGSDSWLGTPGDITSATFDASCAGYDGTTLMNLFANCYSLTTITGLENLNTSKVKEMAYMFFSCLALTSLDLRSFDVSKVTSAYSMFYACGNLATLYVGNWDTSSMKSMSSMFYGCGFASLDLSGWNTASVTDMSQMFYQCTNLKSVYVGDGWSTAAVSSGYNMFYNCSAIVGEDGTTFDSSYLTYDKAHTGAGGYLRNNCLYDAADNSARLTEWNGKTFGAVKISGRTLKAGHWNSLYLPFALTADQIAEAFPAGTEVKTLDSFSNDGTTVTIGFADAASMVAGMPYIVHIPAGENITDPVFNNVLIYPANVIVVKGNAAFMGTYKPEDLYACRYLLFLQNDMLYYPSATVTLNAFRGNFYISGTALPETASANIIIDWGDGETTGIEAVDGGQQAVDGWHTLSGIRLQGKPTEKGIYIVNGKKVAIK